MAVPTLGCDCAVCTSAYEPGSPNRRTRPSVLISYGGHNVVIDTGQDFHVQAVREIFGGSMPCSTRMATPTTCSAWMTCGR